MHFDQPSALRVLEAAPGLVPRTRRAGWSRNSKFVLVRASTGRTEPGGCSNVTAPFMTEEKEEGVCNESNKGG